MQAHRSIRWMISCFAIVAVGTTACSKTEGASADGAGGKGSTASAKNISAGTDIAVSSPTKICTNTHKVGDVVSATVAEAVSGSNGASIPAGSTASLEVVESKQGKNDGDAVRLVVRVASVTVGGETYPLGATVTSPAVDRVRMQSTGEQIGKVATGAAIGAVVGKVAGKNYQSTVAGAVVGAAAGGVIAAGTADYNGCYAADLRLVAKIPNDVRVK